MTLIIFITKLNHLYDPLPNIHCQKVKVKSWYVNQVVETLPDRLRQRVQSHLSPMCWVWSWRYWIKQLKCVNSHKCHDQMFNLQHCRSWVCSSSQHNKRRAKGKTVRGFVSTPQQPNLTTPCFFGICSFTSSIFISIVMNELMCFLREICKLLCNHNIAANKINARMIT